MQSSFNTNLSMYAYMIDYVRRLRDTPNSLVGVNFAGYTDNPNDEYVDNIQKYFIAKRMKDEYPQEVIAECRASGKYFNTKELQLNENSKKFFYNSYAVNNSGYNYSKECAWAIAYVCYGKRGELVNKENHLLTIYRAIYDYEKTYNKKLSSKERSVILHNTNKFLGLESYIFPSNGTYYVLMESEIKNYMGMEEKSYAVVNMSACSNVIFEAVGVKRDEIRLVSQINVYPKDAQAFINGELPRLVNFMPNEIDEAKNFIYDKFNKFLFIIHIAAQA